MADPTIPTEEAPSLTNAHRQQPVNGTQVLALNRSGVLVKAVWTSQSIKYFDAWMYHPKVPQDVKDIQSARFGGNLLLREDGFPNAPVNTLYGDGYGRDL